VPFDSKEIEKMVMKEMRKIYSEKAIDYAMNLRNMGRLEKSDGLAKITGPCGDTMEISLKISCGRISDARFWTDGCGSSIACGSVITELIKGKSISEAEKVEYTTVLGALDGLSDSDVHCSLLASKTLKAAIESCGGQENFKASTEA
jgi:nitrogen fixation NifU-like protein